MSRKSTKIETDEDFKRKMFNLEHMTMKRIIANALWPELDMANVPYEKWERIQLIELEIVRNIGMI
jgi:hypothetical protein